MSTSRRVLLVSSLRFRFREKRSIFRFTRRPQQPKTVPNQVVYAATKATVLPTVFVAVPVPLPWLLLESCFVTLDTPYGWPPGEGRLRLNSSILSTAAPLRRPADLASNYLSGHWCSGRNQEGTGAADVSGGGAGERVACSGGLGIDLAGSSCRSSSCARWASGGAYHRAYTHATRQGFLEAMSLLATSPHMNW